MTVTNSRESVQVTVAVGDVGYALDLMAKSFYGTYFDAVRELVINAVEAGASIVTIVLDRSGSRPYIAVEDNGSGMTRDFLAELPRRICDSVKRDQRGLTGRNGVGLPTAGRKLGATELHVVSTTKGQREVVTLVFPLIGKNPTASVRQEETRTIRGGCGTRVFLYGVTAKVTRGLSRGLRGASRLAEQLSLAFGSRVSRGELTICIERRTKRGRAEDEHVAPIKYRGERVEVSSQRTSRGTISFELYLKHPGSDGTVVLQHSTGPLLTDITSLADFGRDPWHSFEGEITASFLNRTGGGVDTADRDYRAFRTAIQTEVEPTLRQLLVERSIGRLAPDEVRGLRAAFKDALGNLPLGDLPLGKLKVPRTLAASAGGRIRLAQRDDLGGTTGPITNRGAGKTPFATPAKTPLASSPVSRNQVRRMGTTKVSALKWQLGPFATESSHLPYEVKDGVIFINTRHPDFVKFTSPPTGQSAGTKYRRRRKLLWMIMVTCMVLVDLNMSLDEYTEMERRVWYGMLYGEVADGLHL